MRQGKRLTRFDANSGRNRRAAFFLNERRTDINRKYERSTLELSKRQMMSGNEKDTFKFPLCMGNFAQHVNYSVASTNKTSRALGNTQHSGEVSLIFTMQCGISLLSYSHLANIKQFLLKVSQTRFPQNSICSGNFREIPIPQDSDSTPILPGILPCVWCTTEWHHTNTKWKSRLLVWMM